MKINKLIAGVLSLCLFGGAVPASETIISDHSITASAAEYTEGTYGVLTYKNYGDHIEISGCNESATSVEIPSEIDGLPVTSIGEDAFYYCSSLISVNIPNSVTSIGNGAFIGCSSLIEIALPNSVTIIEDYAFTDCSNLKSIAIPDGITNIGKFTFSGCSSLTGITIPDGVTSIGWSGFEKCSGLKSITIPYSVANIDACAFFSCESLTSITIENPYCEIFYRDDGGIPTICNSLDENHEAYFNGTIYGYDNSTAQAYAEKYSYNFKSLGKAPKPSVTMKGDVNTDGIIDLSDAAYVLTIYAENAAGLSNNSYSVQQLKNADVNGDGVNDITDAALILQYYAMKAAGLDASWENILTSH